MTGNFNSLESFVLRRAFLIFVLYNVLLFTVYPAIRSEPPYVRPNLAPAIVVVALGFLIWIGAFVIYLRAFRGSEHRPSIVSGLVFLTFFGTELLAAALTLRLL